LKTIISKIFRVARISHRDFHDRAQARAYARRQGAKRAQIQMVSMRW